jgi:hypothetical protein
MGVMKEAPKGREESMTGKTRFETGLTLRVILAIFFASFFFMPISIYLQLVTGVLISGIAVFVTAIIFSELSIVTASPLKKQELFIIFQMSGIAGTTTYMVELIYRGYMISSPLSKAFRIGGLPLSELIPTWWAPPAWSDSYLTRTLFSVDWAIPTLLTVVYGVLTILTELALLIMTSLLYIEVEKLPFPMAPPIAELVNTLAERKPYRIGLFSESAAIGMLIGIIVHIPRITLGIQAIPFPWADFTGFTEQYIPGAIVGIATEPLSYISGMLIPWVPAVYMLITSVICWIILNSAFITVFPQAFPKWSRDYTAGMGISLLYQRSQLHVWLWPQIIFGLTLSLFFLIRGVSSVKRALRTLAHLPPSLRQIGYPPLPVVLAMYLTGTLGSVVLFHILVPEMPIIIPIFLSVGLSFLNAIVGARILGETGQSFATVGQNMWRPFIYVSGYKGVNGWLITPVIGGGLASGWTQDIKIAYLTETRLGDFLKAFILAWIAYRVFGFMWGSFFWTFAPIPSSVYPYTVVDWPIRLMTDGMWITRQLDVSLNVALASFGGMVAVLIAGTALSKFIGLPFSPSSIVAGTATIPPAIIPVFIGSTLGRFLVPRIFGKEWWDEHRALIVAGFATGEGIAIGIGIVGSLLVRAIWTWPY